MPSTSKAERKNQPVLFYNEIKSSLYKQIIISFFTGISVIGFAWILSFYVPKFLDGNILIRPFVASLLALILLRSIIAYLRERVAVKSYGAISENLVKRILNNLNKKSQHDSKTGVVLTSGIKSLETYYRDYVPAFSEALIVPILVWISIGLVDPISAGIVAITVPLVPIFMVLIGKQTHEMTSRQWFGLSQLSIQFSTYLNGIPTLKMFNAHHKLAAHMEMLSKKYHKVVMKTLRVAFISAFALEAIATLSIAVVAVTLGVRLVDGDVSFAKAIFVLFAVAECYWPLRRLGTAFHSAESGKDAAKEIEELLKNPGVTSEFKKTPNRFSRINIEELSYEVNGTSILNLDKCEFIAGTLSVVVGSNGSGKSTLLNLIRTNLEPLKGQIKGFDRNQKGSSLSIDDVSFVDQACTLYGDTVKEAICFSQESYDLELLEQLSRQLSIFEVLEKSTKEISGGQKQRVAIARALYDLTTEKKSVLILDEPTSFLDEQSSQAVIDILNQCKNEQNIVIVASHDTRLIEKADTKVELGNVFRRSTQDAQGIDSNVTISKDKEIESLDSMDNALVLFRNIYKKIVSKSIISLLISVVADISTIALGLTALWLITRASEQPVFSELALAALFVRAFGVSKAVFRYGERLHTHSSALALISNLRKQTIKRLIDLLPGACPELRKGDAIERFVEDHDRAQDLYVRALLPAMSAFVSALLVSIFILVIDFRAGILLVLNVILLGIVLPLLSIRFEWFKIRNTRSYTQKYFLEAFMYVDAIDLLNSDCSRSYARSRVIKALHEKTRTLEDLNITSGLLKATYSSAAPLGLILLSVFWLNQTDTSNGPVFVLVFLSVVSIFSVFEQNSRFGETFISSLESWNRIKVLLSKDSIVEDAGDLKLEATSELTLSKAVFAWDENFKTQETTFTLNEKNRFMEIIGPSGCGKSSIASGLVRFIPLMEGQYLIESNSIECFTCESVRNNVLHIQQYPWLAPGTIRSNLNIGNDQADDDAMKKALDMVGGSGLYATQDGLDRNLGIDGDLISGGEKAKISLARSLLSYHQVVIFDEPKASIDLKSQKSIDSAIKNEIEKRFVVLLSHSQE